jgi:hypothetical protein
MQAQYKEMLSILPMEVAQEFSGDSAAANIKLIETLPMQKLFVKESFARSLRLMWIFYTSVAILGFMLSMLISR